MDISRDELLKGLEEEQFKLHYQPIISLKHLTVAGVEALIRWKHPDHGLLTPNYFLKALDENHLLHQAGQWVFTECLDDWQTWIEDDDVDNSLFLSMNVSYDELEEGNFIETITETIQERSILPQTFYLELEEQTAFALNDNHPNLLERMSNVSPIHLCVDNFGRNEPSLDKLKRLPVKTIKFDRNFLNPESSNDDQTEFAKYLIQYANDNGYTVIAEGIENRKLFEKYYDFGCQYGQGFYFSKPITGDPSGILDKEELKSIVSEIGGPNFLGRSEFLDAKILDLDILMGVPESPLRDMLEHILIRHKLNYTSTCDPNSFQKKINESQWNVLLLDDKSSDEDTLLQCIDKFLSNGQERFVMLLKSEGSPIDDERLNSYEDLHIHQKPIGADDFASILSAVSFRFKDQSDGTDEANIFSRYLGQGKVKMYLSIFVISILIGLSLGVILSSVSTTIGNFGQSVDSKIERLIDSIEKIEEYERQQTPDR